MADLRKTVTMQEMKNFIAKNPEYRQDIIMDMAMGENLTDIFNFYNQRKLQRVNAEFFDKYL